MNYTKWDKFDIEKALDLVEDDSERQKKYLLSQSSDEHDLKIIKHRIHLREAELKHIFATTKCSINLFQDLESTLESLSNKISVDILKSAGTGRRRRPAATDEPPAPHSPASIHHVEKGFVRSLLGLSSFFVMAFTEIKTLFELSISKNFHPEGYDRSLKLIFKLSSTKKLTESLSVALGLILDRSASDNVSTIKTIFLLCRNGFWLLQHLLYWKFAFFSLSCHKFLLASEFSRFLIVKNQKNIDFYSKFVSNFTEILQDNHKLFVPESSSPPSTEVVPIASSLKQKLQKTFDTFYTLNEEFSSKFKSDYLALLFLMRSICFLSFNSPTLALNNIENSIALIEKQFNSKKNSYDESYEQSYLKNDDSINNPNDFFGLNEGKDFIEKSFVKILNKNDKKKRNDIKIFLDDCFSDLYLYMWRSKGFVVSSSNFIILHKNDLAPFFSYEPYMPRQDFSFLLMFLIEYIEHVMLHQAELSPPLSRLKMFLAKHDIPSLLALFWKEYRFSHSYYEFFASSVFEPDFNASAFYAKINLQDPPAISPLPDGALDTFNSLMKEIFCGFIMHLYYQGQLLYMESHYKSANMKYMASFILCLELMSLQHSSDSHTDSWVFDRNVEYCAATPEQFVPAPASVEVPQSLTFLSLTKIFLSSLYNYTYAYSFITLKKYKTVKVVCPRASFSFFIVQFIFNTSFSRVFDIILKFLQFTGREEQKTTLLLKLKRNILLQKAEKYQEALALNIELMKEIDLFSHIDEKAEKKNNEDLSHFFTSSFHPTHILSQYFLPGFFCPLTFQESYSMPTLSEQDIDSLDTLLANITALTSALKSCQSPFSLHDLEDPQGTYQALEYFKTNSQTFSTLDTLSLVDLHQEVEARIHKLKFLLKKYNIL